MMALALVESIALPATTAIEPIRILDAVGNIEKTVVLVKVHVLRTTHTQAFDELCAALSLGLLE